MDEDDKTLLKAFGIQLKSAGYIAHVRDMDKLTVKESEELADVLRTNGVPNIPNILYCINSRS